MKRTKKDIIFDSIFLVSIVLCVAAVIASYRTAKADVTENNSFQPTTLATVEETTEAMTEPTQEETAVTEETEPSYSLQDVEYLAMAIYQEAGADYISDETRLMVGTVVMNRVADPRFPDTIYEVLTQKRQYGRFYWTGLVWPERASQKVEEFAVARAWACAEKILNGYRAFDSDVIWQAEFVQGSEIVAYQDGIYFCR